MLICRSELCPQTFGLRLSRALSVLLAMSGMDAVSAAPLAKWFVTDFHWPTEADHEVRKSESQTPTGDAVQDEMDTPQYLRLRDNRHFLQRRGAGIFEGVDGYSACDWVREQGIHPSNITLAVWASPHMELSDGPCRSPKLGRLTMPFCRHPELKGAPARPETLRARRDQGFGVPASIDDVHAWL
eukprot:s5356_g2.t1